MNNKKIMSSVFEKISNGKEVNLESQKVELGLVDDIEKEEKKVSDMLGFIDQDVKEIERAIIKAGKIKSDLKRTDNLADNLLRLVKDFEKKADELGVELPNTVSKAGRRAMILKRDNEKLRQLVKSF